MKDRCVICYGVIPMIDVVGVSVPEEQVTRSDRTFPRLSVSLLRASPRWGGSCV